MYKLIYKYGNDGLEFEQTFNKESHMKMYIEMGKDKELQVIRVETIDSSNIYGYCRCSTNEEKQNIDRQVRELKAAGVKDENIFTEYESGTKEERRELNKLLNAVKAGDTIITTEVSRISRSTKQLIDIIQFAKDKKLKLIMGTFILDCTGEELDPMAKAMLQIMGVFAELERDMISNRVKSGMANARDKGKVIGRPTTSINDIPGSFLKHYPKLKNKDVNKTELSKLTGLSRPTINKYIKIIEGQE